jgi:xanthosine utilization system XapX-like protein
MALDFNNLSVGEYDTVEKEMLNDFSNFVRQYPSFKWIHWNMRDSNYGFEAINNRIEILGGQPFDVADDFKYDLPRILGQIYTYGYEANKPKGRLLNLADRNNITTKQALTGEEEASAFDNKEYLKLHISTLRKVDIIDTIIDRTETGSLRVNVSKKHIYGLTLPGSINLIKETPWLLLIIGLIGYLIGAALEPVVQRAFGTSGD